MENSLRVLSTLALRGAVRSLAGECEAASGFRIDADFAPTLALIDRLQKGETADVLILTREGLAGLAATGEVDPSSCIDLARSHVGLAVRAGTPHPDIATEDALRTTLLSARSIAYSGLGASGIFFARLIEQMGIAPEINGRATIVPQGFTAERLMSGEADLAVNRSASSNRSPASRSSEPSRYICRKRHCFPPGGCPRRRRLDKPAISCSFSPRQGQHLRCVNRDWSRSGKPINRFEPDRAREQVCA